MGAKTIHEMPSLDKFMKSPHDLDYIRKKLSGIFQNNVDINNSQLATLELILCLANEIDELKRKVSDLSIC